MISRVDHVRVRRGQRARQPAGRHPVHQPGSPSRDLLDVSGRGDRVHSQPGSGQHPLGRPVSFLDHLDLPMEKNGRLLEHFTHFFLFSLAKSDPPVDRRRLRRRRVPGLPHDGVRLGPTGREVEVHLVLTRGHRRLDSHISHAGGAVCAVRLGERVDRPVRRLPLLVGVLAYLGLQHAHGSPLHLGRRKDLHLPVSVPFFYYFA